MKLGCQTITWGENQRDHFPTVFAEIASAGFSGVEIGFRHIQHTPPTELKRMLDTAGLSLIATHLGGNLENADQAAGERDTLHQALDYLEQMGAASLMYSGLKYQDDSQFRQDLQMLRRWARRCRDRNVALLYHNHDWEFTNDARVMEALLEEPSIGYCPDIGWIMKGGGHVPTWLERMGRRIGAIHFKDFATGKAVAKGVVDTVLLGNGAAPLAAAAEWAAQHVPEAWMIAEQDKTDQPTTQVVRHNGDFLRHVFKLRGKAATE